MSEIGRTNSHPSAQKDHCPPRSQEAMAGALWLAFVTKLRRLRPCVAAYIATSSRSSARVCRPGAYIVPAGFDRYRTIILLLDPEPHSMLQRRVTIMKPTQRTLSKSRFIEGFPCPTRLFYRRHSDTYGLTTDDDPFLKQLAEGGFQVGALARLSWPEGVMLDTLDFDEAERQTRALLHRHEVVIFEAALRLGDAIARVDVLVKKGNTISLIEVKAKSFAGSKAEFWRAPEDDGAEYLDTDWLPKLADVAFQTVLCRGAWPQLETTPFLMLADKRARATVDGLHQKFRLVQGADGRRSVDLHGDVGAEALGASLLTQVDVSEEVEALLAGTASAEHGPLAQHIDQLAGVFVHGEKTATPIGKRCRKCPCRIEVGTDLRGLSSGFEACWHSALGVDPIDLRTRPLVLDVPRLAQYDTLMREKILFLQDLTREQVYPLEKAKKTAPRRKPRKDAKPPRPGLELRDRHWKRVEKIKAGDASPHIDRDGLRDVMAKWTFPLHFIDFETMTAAVPFHRGLRPYETLAFQFSHHVLEADGSVAHRTQWVESRAGVFPNFDFVRKLRTALGSSGTIFRFADHENTVLCHILRQLHERQPAPDDADELTAWIKTVTHSPSRAKEGDDVWCGPRDIQDLKKVAERHVLMPQAKGSNSLKLLLPACMSSSTLLKRKYSGPIYGADGGIASLNFRDQVWWQAESSGGAKDPYALLAADNPAELAAVGGGRGRDIDDGGSTVTHGSDAMRAYELLQYTDLGDERREAVVRALLRYCELDTLAMVMLVESWRDEVGIRG